MAGGVSGMEADKLMVDGYLAGFKSSLAEPPPVLSAFWPVSYRHGWLNGRDDRIRSPRATADVLRRRAEMILGACK